MKKNALVFLVILTLLVVSVQGELVVFKEKIDNFSGNTSLAAEEILKERAAYAKGTHHMLFLYINNGAENQEIQIAIVQPFPRSLQELQSILFTPEVVALVRENQIDFAFDLMEQAMQSALNQTTQSVQEVVGAYCNTDGVCNNDENENTCPKDCKAALENAFCRILKDGYCDPMCNGDLDCKCGNAVCERFENPLTCPKDCKLDLQNYYCHLLQDSVCDASCFLGDVDCFKVP